MKDNHFIVKKGAYKFCFSDFHCTDHMTAAIITIYGNLLFSEERQNVMNLSYALLKTQPFYNEYFQKVKKRGRSS